MRRILLSILVLFALCAGFSGAANATCAGGDCYWKGPGAWSSTAQWYDDSGLTTPCTCTPPSGANIHLVAASGNLTLDGAHTIGDFDAAAYVGTFNWGNNGYVLSSNKVGAAIVFGTGMTATSADNGSGLNFTAGSGTATLDGGGISGLGAITVGAGETVNQVGHSYNALPINQITVQAANAAFNLNGQTLTIGHMSINSGNTRSFNCGTGTLALTATDGGTLLDTRTSGGLTYTCNLGTLLLNPTLKSVNLFLGSETYGAVVVNNTGSAANLVVQSGTPTYGSLTLQPYTSFTSALTISVSGAMACNGTAAKPVTIDQGAGPRTINAAGGFTGTYCYLAGITKGTGAWNIVNSFDGGFNSGFSVGTISAGSPLVGL